MFVSVDGKAKEVTEIFAGGTDGKAHKVTELFGSVNGIAKQLFSYNNVATNSFDLYSWAEIKGMANNGTLMEHFNLFDTVRIKLTKVLEDTISVPIGNGSTSEKVNVYQNELYLQIVELTPNKMRLMSPRATIFTGRICPSVNINTAGIEKTRYYDWTYDWSRGTGMARSIYQESWGLTEGYDRLKEIDNALPEDFRNALSVCSRPLIEYTAYHATGQTKTVYDEDMRVRQVSDDLWRTHINYDDIPYTIDLDATYYPRTANEYGYYIKLPKELEQYKSNLMSWRYGRLELLGFVKEGKDNLKLYNTLSPSIAFEWDRNNYALYNQYSNECKRLVYQGNSSGGVIIPEMIIAADTMVIDE